jgi:transposase
MIDHETFTWFAAIDWGTEKHQACVVDVRGGIAGERAFSHDGVGLALLCDWILSIAGNATMVAVAVEVLHGPVVDVLLDRGLAVYAINPKQLDRLRDRFSVSGAKDDRRDAYVAADGLRTDRHLFRRLQIADPRLIQLREWSRLAEQLQQERVRLSNRLYSPIFGQWRPRQRRRCTSARPALRSCFNSGGIIPRCSGSATKRNRIRRIDAETVLRALREPAITN